MEIHFISSENTVYALTKNRVLIYNGICWTVRQNQLIWSRYSGRVELIIYESWMCSLLQLNSALVVSERCRRNIGNWRRFRDMLNFKPYIWQLLNIHSDLCAWCNNQLTNPRRKNRRCHHTEELYEIITKQEKHTTTREARESNRRFYLQQWNSTAVQ